MFSLFFALLLGILAGTFTGIVPGVHINLVAVLLLSSGLMKTVPSLVLAVFVVAMAITHTFLDFIPSVFLGAPEPGTSLSVLPGHRFLLKGKGYAAVKLTVIGSYFGLLFALVLIPLFLVTVKAIYPFLSKTLVFVLLGIVALLILKERKKLLALVIFLLSGLLGLATLNLAPLKQPLLPLLSGLFGTSLLSLSFLRNVKLPKQGFKEIKLTKKETFKALGAGMVSSSLVAFLPGVGPAQAAIISTAFWKKITNKAFLVVLGSINTIVMLLSFLSLYLLGKPRTGAAVAVGKLLSWFSFNHLLMLAAVALVAGSIAVFITLWLAKRFALKLVQLNYKWLCFSVILFVVCLTIAISGLYGLLVLAVATSLGIATILLYVRKMHLMGCLLFPVIIQHLGGFS